MATTNSESLTELERRAETTRAELAQTVDALHSRVSPSALKADVRSYVRDNPLQAAAVAVGVAYPVWRLLANMPAPVLLIGAGLAMSRRGGRSGYGTAYESQTNGDGMMATLKEKASGIAGEISGKAQETMESVRSMAFEKTSSASETISDTYANARDAAAERAQQVADQVSETYARTRDTVTDMIERHPMLAGGVAFAVGSIIAAAVPVSRQEGRLMGGTSEEMRRRAADVAIQGLREAGTAARQVYQTAAEEMRNEGLTPEVARHTARAAVERAREAVEHTASAVSQPDGSASNNSRT